MKIHYLTAVLLAAHPLGALPLPEPREVTTDYHGTFVPDPYRYFEERDQAEVAAWSKALSDHSIAQLATLPERARIARLIAEADQLQGDKVGWIIEPAPELYYFLMRRQSDEIELLFHQMPGGQPELLLDPRSIVDGGGLPVTIKNFSISPDLKHLAITITAGGGEMASLYIFDPQARKVTEGPYERVRWGAGEWLPDSSGFFYNRLQKLGPDADPLETFQRSIVYLHQLGTGESDDRPVFGIAVNQEIPVKPEEIVFVSPVSDSGWVAAVNSRGVSLDNIYYIARLDELLAGKPHWRKVCEREDMVGSRDGGSLEIYDDHLFLLSRKNAPNGKIVRLSLKDEGSRAMESVYEPTRGSIQEFTGRGDALYLRTLDAGPSRLVRLPWNSLGEPEVVKTAGEGRISLHQGLAGHPKRTGVNFTFASWTHPPRNFHVAPGNAPPRLIKLPQLAEPPVSAELISHQMMIKGHDDVNIPVSIIHKKDLDRNQTHPVMLTAYGAYGISIQPGFRATESALFEMGGIKVIAHVRGGGELGEEWRLAGYQKTKPNTWKDMLSAAEGLVREGYTTPRQICIHGGSAGGITVGRAMTEKPDAVGAVLIGVGVTDALRLENSPNGVPNIPEFGSVITKAGFDALYRMSAYHHVKDGTRYPPTMLYHGANDTRVDLWQSQKMAARLIAAQGDEADVLLRIDYKTGHGSGASRQQENDLQADILAFFFSRCR